MFQPRLSISPILLAVAVVMAGGALFSLTAKAQEPDPVVATVNGGAIFGSDVKNALTRLPQQLRSMPAEQLIPMVINNLVDTRLVADMARSGGLQGDAEVKKQMAQIEDRILEQVYLQRYINSRVTDGMLRENYEKFVAKQGPQKQIRARHILLKTEKQAQKMIEQIKGGEDFAELAKANSIGPTGSRGGDLGFFAKGQMVPEFSQAAFALEPGSVTKTPVKTQFGWHVIKVEDVRNVPPPSFEAAKENLKTRLGRNLVAELIKSFRAEANIKINKPLGIE